MSIFKVVCTFIFVQMRQAQLTEPDTLVTQTTFFLNHKTPPVFLDSLRTSTSSLALQAPKAPSTSNAMFDAVPNLQSFIGAMGGLGYGMADFVNEFRAPTQSKNVQWLKFQKISGSLIEGLSTVGKLCNFVGPVLSFVFSFINPSVSNQDVIDKLNRSIDNSTQIIIAQMQASFMSLSEHIALQTSEIKQSIYEINAYAAQRALIDNIAILDNLNDLVSDSQSSNIQYWQAYEQFPCGSAMSLCNNAFSQIAYSMDDVLTSLHQYAISSKQDTYPLIQQYGEYLLALLLQSSVSLTLINKQYAISQFSYVQQQYDLKTHLIASNSQRLQANYLKAQNAYFKILFQSEYQLQNLTYMNNYGSNPFNSLFKGIQLAQESKVASCIYGYGAWNTMSLITGVKTVVTMESNSLNDTYLQSFLKNKEGKYGYTTDKMYNFTHIESKNTVQTLIICPQGLFLQKINGDYFDCAQLAQTFMKYNDTYYVELSNSLSFQSTFEYVRSTVDSYPTQTQFINSSNFEQGLNCSKPGYFISGVDRKYTRVTTNCIYKILGQFPEKLQVSQYFYGLFSSICDKGFESLTRIYCSKPHYAVSFKQFQIIKTINSLSSFIIVNDEAVNIDQVYKQLFMENCEFTYVEEVTVPQGPSFTNNTKLVLYNNSYYLVTSFAKYFIENKQILFSTQLDVKKSVSINNSLSLDALPTIKWNIFNNSNKTLRFIDVNLEQSNYIPAELSSYNLTFYNLNAYPVSCLFVVILPSMQYFENIPSMVCSLQVQGQYLNDTLCIMDQSKLTITIKSNFLRYTSQTSLISLVIYSLRNPVNVENQIQSLALYVYSNEAFDMFIEGSSKVIFPKFQCQWPCRTCVMNAPTQCLSCLNKHIYPFILNGTTCLSCMDLKYTQTRITNNTICVKTCPLQTAINGTVCYDCQQGQFVRNKTCVSQCSNRTSAPFYNLTDIDGSYAPQNANLTPMCLDFSQAASANVYTDSLTPNYQFTFFKCPLNYTYISGRRACAPPVNSQQSPKTLTKYLSITDNQDSILDSNLTISCQSSLENASLIWNVLDELSLELLPTDGSQGIYVVNDMLVLEKQILEGRFIDVSCSDGHYIFHKSYKSLSNQSKVYLIVAALLLPLVIVVIVILVKRRQRHCLQLQRTLVNSTEHHDQSQVSVVTAADDLQEQSLRQHDLQLGISVQTKHNSVGMGFSRLQSEEISVSVDRPIQSVRN